MPMKKEPKVIIYSRIFFKGNAIIKICSCPDMSNGDIALWIWLRYHDDNWKYDKMLDECKFNPDRLHMQFIRINNV